MHSPPTSAPSPASLTFLLPSRSASSSAAIASWSSPTPLSLDFITAAAAAPKGSKGALACLLVRWLVDLLAGLPV